MKVPFLEAAQEELDDAADYFELSFDGLGFRFRQEVKLAINRIARHPHAWSVELEDVRKCLLHKFHTSFYIPSKRITFS